ncbi:hypothetical protein KW842_06895 [Duganella sp. sic0402]|uniref:hypothetical protein n=1 Tax=Duganella sp. sic0402 TaxID=2854786 RepID=UPI001C4382CA|nr:hypothetical protein [Duganella sp. sic0402]MBV7535487.1 hypothetical protein [Duganella sp. sic0402]
MMIVAEFAFYLFMEVLMYSLGRFVIFIISFGRARAVRTREIFSNKMLPPYADDGKMLVPEWGVVMVGVLTLTAAFSIFFALR